MDVEAEQKAVEQAQLLVLQPPLYWYSYASTPGRLDSISEPQPAPPARLFQGGD
ncbi:NAD(P)H-dependent oxidoreductase [Pseudomonas orientalis]|nr:NAD(P)H-dependent oxidoreductase [Pseudomonas orientalis]UOB26623.1 NAD(P)H-dependent oxidoreductase [Pseudomonas orientalis]